MHLTHPHIGRRGVVAASSARRTGAPVLLVAVIVRGVVATVSVATAGAGNTEEAVVVATAVTTATALIVHEVATSQVVAKVGAVLAAVKSRQCAVTSLGTAVSALQCCGTVRISPSQVRDVWRPFTDPKLSVATG